MRSNKSPEPTAVGAVSSAVAVNAASRRWLSFFRLATYEYEHTNNTKNDIVLTPSSEARLDLSRH